MIVVASERLLRYLGRGLGRVPRGDDEIVVAERLVGDDGAVIVVIVVADAVLDGELVPTELIADTL